jgi:hypothetical protein
MIELPGGRDEDFVLARIVAPGVIDLAVERIDLAVQN